MEPSLRVKRDGVIFEKSSFYLKRNVAIRKCIRSNHPITYQRYKECNRHTPRSIRTIYPMITGATAPPTIVMISNEEASLVLVPASLNASEKIVGNMMLSPRYKAKNAKRDKVPLHTS